MTQKMDLLGRLELQVVRDPSTGNRKVVFRNQRGELLDPVDNPELMATFAAGGITQADLSAALATKANAASLAAKADTSAVTAAISAQHTADNGAYAQQSTVKPVAGRRGCYLGTSITNGSTASNVIYSFPWLATAILGTAAARGDYIEAGTPGATTANGVANLPGILATYTDIGYLVIEYGPNDAGQNFTLATFSANVVAMVGMAKAKGIPVVLCTGTPRGSGVATTALRNLIFQFNTWIRLWGPANGCEIAENYGALVDPATGDMLAAYDSGDGIHPNSLGHTKMAQAVAQALYRLFNLSVSRRPSGSPLAAATGLSIVANPLMTGTVGAGMATSWYEQPGGTGTAPTYSKIADTTGLLPAGQWLQMDFDATASGGLRIMANAPGSLGGVVGNVLAATSICLVEDLTGTWEADNVAGTAEVNPMQILNQASAGVFNMAARCPGLNLGNLLGTGNTVWLLGPFLSPFTIPSGMTGYAGVFCRVKLPTGKHIKVRLGCTDLVNLTTLGLSSLVGGSATVSPAGT